MEPTMFTLLLAPLIALMLVIVQPGSSEPPAKTIPGQPGTNGAGGDSSPSHAVTPLTPSPTLVAPAVPFPHPLITEVLYAVPSGLAGDANKDGKRESAGDEFVELVNPHDKPIQLFGYTLTDSQEPGKGQMRFVFPAMELAPGGVVVVFNGMNSTFVGGGATGDNKTPPTGPSELFGGAWVFSMRNTNNHVALGNSGDHVMLIAPDGVRIQRVWWSEESGGASATKPVAPGASADQVPPPVVAAGAKAPPKPPLIDDFAPLVTKMSVTRDGVLGSGRFVSTMDAEHVAFSPGVYRIPTPPTPPPAAKPSAEPRPDERP